MPRAQPEAAALPTSHTPRLSLIVAVARNRVIGAGNRMPWHLSADLRRFRALTTGHRIIMGRKTWESLGKPLPGRENVIVSRNAQLAAPGCIVVGSLDAAMQGSTLPPPLFCIGGAEIYAAALPLADEIWLTEIDADFEGDATMPELPQDEWRETAREPAVDPASGLRYAFVHLQRAQHMGALQSGRTPPTRVSTAS
jgi:dihydrofolate reductase